MEKITSMLPANLRSIVVTDTGHPSLVQTDEGPGLDWAWTWPIWADPENNYMTQVYGYLEPAFGNPLRCHMVTYKGSRGS